LRTAYLKELDAYENSSKRVRAIFEPILKRKDLLTKTFVVKGPFYTFNTSFTDEERMDWEYLQSQRSLTDEQQAVWDKLNEKRTKGEIKQTEYPLTLEQLMFVYANSRNAGNKAHLYGSGWTDESIHAAEDLLQKEAPEGRKAVDELIYRFYDQEQYDRLNEGFRRVFDIDMPKVEGYFPITGIISTKAETAIAADLIARHSARAGVNRGFTKVRVQSLAPFRQMSLFWTVFDNVQKVEHFIAMSEPIREVNRFLHQKQLMNTLQNRDAHFDCMEYLDDFLKRMSYGKIKNTQSSIDRIADWLRFNYTTYVLGFSIRSMAKTFANLPVASKYVSPARIARAASDMLTHGMDLYEAARGKSAYMRHRSESYDREIHEMRERFAEKPMFNLAMGANEKARKWSMVGLTTLDKINTTIVWTAKYREVLNETADEEQAVRLADEAVENSTPGGGLLYYTRAQMATGALARSFTMFMSDLAKIYNAFHETVHTIHGAKDLPEVAWELALLAIIPGLWVYAVDHAFDWRRLWEDPEGWIGACLSQLYGGVALVSQIGDIVYTNLIANPLRKARGAPEQRGPSSTIQIPWATSISEIGQPLSDLWHKRWGPAALHTIDFFGALTGAPLKQVVTIGKGATALARGETEDVRRVLYSPYQLKDMSVTANTARQLRSANKETRLEAIRRFSRMSEEDRAAVREARHREAVERARKRAVESRR
jgi:hypothetical protein